MQIARVLFGGAAVLISGAAALLRRCYMRLRHLDGRLIKRNADGSKDPVTNISDADGVIMQCPKCAESCEAGHEANRYFFRGAHYIICWFVGKVPDDLDPKPGRWTPQGQTIDDLTFVPGDPPRLTSVLMTNPGGCRAHFHVKDGETVPCES